MDAICAPELGHLFASAAQVWKAIESRSPLRTSAQVTIVGKLLVRMFKTAIGTPPATGIFIK